MRHRPLSLITAALMAASVSTAANAQSETTTEPAETTVATPSMGLVLATVNGTDLTLGHVLAMRSELPQEYSSLPANVLFPAVLDQLIQQTLLMEEARVGLSTQARVLIENETRAIMAGEAVRSILGQEVDQAAVQAAYAEQFESAAAQTEYKASHILVETPEEAAALRDEIEAGADFAEMAKEHSTGPSGASGGDLGWFAEGRMVAEFFEAVTTLEVDEVSAPVQTSFGWHLIKLVETRDREIPGLEEVRAQIENDLRQKVLEDSLAALEAGAEIQRADLSEIDPNVINQLELLGN